MIESISLRILDILQADARIYRGGLWTGVERNPDVPTDGLVHLFDSPFEPDSNDVHPAIYVGAPGNGGSDEEEILCNSGGLVEMRLAKIPLYLVVSIAADTSNAKLTCRRLYAQLKANVVYILMDNHTDTANNWYLLERPGQRGGGDMRIGQTLAATGQEGQGRVMCVGVIPLAVHYSLVAGGSSI